MNSVYRQSSEYRESIHRAHVLLVIIFVAKVSMSVLTLFVAVKPELITLTIIGFIVFTLFLAVLWPGKGWARYCLMLVLSISVLMRLWTFPKLAQNATGPWIAIFIASGVLDGLSVWILAGSRNIKKLARR